MLLSFSCFVPIFCVLYFAFLSYFFLVLFLFSLSVRVSALFLSTLLVFKKCQSSYTNKVIISIEGSPWDLNLKPQQY